tara:strand:+ start:5529 stop:5939 length:411 start_codon:yes stop_codon:yes gene_type:complete
MDITALPGLPDDGSGPVFASPCQAQVFSLVVGLHEAGCFSWNEWAEALSRKIAEDPTGGVDGVQAEEETDPSDSYYRFWVSALENILARKTILDSDEIQKRVAEWREAYLNTPHGAPVTLPSADEQIVNPVRSGAL